MFSTQSTKQNLGPSNISLQLVKTCMLRMIYVDNSSASVGHPESVPAVGAVFVLVSPVPFAGKLVAPTVGSTPRPTRLVQTNLGWPDTSHNSKW